MNMETPGDSIESLFERAEAYSRTTYELSKLKLLETTNIVVTSVIARLSVIMMISMFSFVLSIAVALWLGDILGKSYYGFFIVAGFYFIAGIVLHLFLHRWVKKPISELIIKQALQ
jgi:membrane-associated HD superfamily phosphohydrolase